MNIVNKIMVLFSMIIISGSVLGQTSGSDRAQVPQDRMITEVQTFSDYAVIGYEPGFTNDLCPGTSGSMGWARIVAANAANRQLLDNALAALLEGMYVGFGLEDVCHPQGSGMIPSIYRVDLPPSAD